jgi:hypothetical protein
MEASAENGQVKRLDIRQKGKPLRNRFSERDKERERERERERWLGVSFYDPFCCLPKQHLLQL